MLNLNTNDYVQVVWAASTSNVSLTSQAAQTNPFTMPGVPSATIAILQL